MNAALVLMVSGLLVSAVTPVEASSEKQTLPLALFWSAPPECPDENGVRDAILSRLSHDVRPSGTIDAQAVIVTTPGGRYRLHLRTRVDNRDGERTISHEDCAQLAQAAALVLALLIDPNASPTPVKSSPEPAPTPPPATTPPTAPPTAPTAPPTAPTTTAPPTAAPTAPPVTTPPFRQTSIGVEADASYGRLPGLAGGGHVRIARDGRYWGAELRLGGWLPKQQPASSIAGAGGRFWMADLGAGGCMHSATTEAVGVQGCLGGRASRVSGTSYGVSDPGSTSAWLLSAYLSAGIRVRLASHLRVRWTFEGALQPSRPWFSIGGIGNVYRPPLGSIGTSLGFDVTF